MGQSPLQVAVKTAQFDIAYYLIEQGADCDFMESEEHGANPAKPASNGFAAPDHTVCEAENILERQSAYPNVQELCEERLAALLDILLAHGADFYARANRGHYPEPSPGEPNRERYIDDFVPQEDITQEYTVGGQTRSTY